MRPRVVGALMPGQRMAGWHQSRRNEKIQRWRYYVGSQNHYAWTLSQGGPGINARSENGGLVRRKEKSKGGVIMSPLQNLQNHHAEVT